MGKKVFFILGILLLVALGILARNLYQHRTGSTTYQSTYPKVTPETALLVDVAVWYPSAPWSEPKESSQTTIYGDLTGESMEATVTSQNATLSHFEQVQTLAQKGFLPDNNLAADGPGSSVWGYKATPNGKSQVIIFSYQTLPSSKNPNEPLQFNCPCRVGLSVFVSNPF